MRQPRDFLVSLMVMLGMKGGARLDSAMSERIGRHELMEVLGSGNVCYEDKRHAEALSQKRLPSLVGQAQAGSGEAELHSA